MYCAFPNVFNTMIYLPSPFLGAWMFASSHILTHPCRSSYVLVYPHIFSHISAVHLISLQIFVDPCRSSYLLADLHIYIERTPYLVDRHFVYARTFSCTSHIRIYRLRVSPARLAFVQDTGTFACQLLAALDARSQAFACRTRGPLPPEGNYHENYPLP